MGGCQSNDAISVSFYFIIDFLQANERANTTTISTEKLESMLGNPKLRVVDCSVGMGRQPGDCHRLGFLKSHIKGAQFLDLDNLKDLKTDLPFMMPTEQQFCDQMKRINIRQTDTVVCYETGGM